MPVEIEIKFKVDDLEPVRARLRELGAMQAGMVLETNVFFDTPQRTLAAADRGLRIRQNVDAATGRRWQVITYKGPRESGELKRREEIEFGVEDFEAAAALLEGLGFAKMLEFEKKRETWRLENCKVELDELPELGTFVEMEGPSNEAVMRCRQELGFAGKPAVIETYSALVAASRQ
jgi:adenylate cyclase class 2